MDPNEIVSRGQPIDFYISDDWTRYDTKPGPGLKKVKVQVITYADGRKHTVVLDESGNPHPSLDPSGQPVPNEPGGAPIRRSTDPDREKIWQQQSRQAQPDNVPAPANQPNIVTRNPDGSVNTTPNPNYQPPAARTETTNETDQNGNPVTVTRAYDKDGNVIGVESKPRSATAASAHRVVTTDETDQNGNPVRVTRSYDANGTLIGEKSDPRTPEKPQTQFITRNGKTYRVTVNADGSVATEEVAGIPAEQTKPNRTTVKGADGRTYVVTVNDDGSATANAVEGLPAETPQRPRMTDPNTGATLEQHPDGVWRPIRVEGVPQSDLQTPVLEYGQIASTLQQYNDMLDQEVAAGRMTRQEADRRFQRVYQIATHKVNEINAEVARTQREYDQRVAQRNSDIDVANTRMGAANTHTGRAFEMSRHYAPTAGGGGGPSLFTSALALQGLTANQYGGFNVPPRVPLPPDPRTVAAGMGQPPGAPAAGAAPGAAPATAPPAPNGFDPQRASEQFGGPPPPVFSPGGGVGVGGPALPSLVPSQTAAPAPEPQSRAIPPSFQTMAWQNDPVMQPIVASMRAQGIDDDTIDFLLRGQMGARLAA